MDRETCEHGAPISQICERCDLTAVERLGLAISNAGITWTNEMREEWDKSADEIKLLRLKLKEVINECGEYACENNGLKQQIAKRQALLDRVSAPVAWLHIMDNTEGIQENEPWIEITLSPQNPFGEAGIDYSKSYLVTSTPLYTIATT